MVRRYVSKVFDLRAGEARAALLAFATLFLIITAHTTLETARDALFLTKLPASQLNVVYFVLAGLTFVFAWASARMGALFGRRNALICSLVGAAYGTTLLHFLPPTPRVALGLYVFSGLVGAVLVPQFWMLAAQMFTVAQGRRLFGPIASGGVIGAVVGAGAAAAVVEYFPVTSLLLFAAGLFVVTAMLLTAVSTFPAEEAGTASAPRPSLPPPEPVEVEPPPRRGAHVALFRENPLLLRIAALVAISTAGTLVADYLFKSTVARFVAASELGEFFARYYAGMNALSLIVQLVVAGRLVRRIGVVGAVAVMPFLFVAGGVGALVAGGAFYAVLALKGVDGALRHSVNRVSTELLYLPLPPEAREQGKGFIDSVLGRIVQATTAVVLYGLAAHGLASPRVLALVVVALSACWLALAATVRGTYLDLFRRTLNHRDWRRTASLELDLASAEAIVESMASPDPDTVIGAMEVLDLHGRTKLIPALVLYHEADRVLVHALGLFGASKRVDWIPLGQRLLTHPGEAVRIATVRALARHGRIELIRKATDDISSKVQGYAAFHVANNASDDLLEHPLIMVIMKMPGEIGRASRVGLLAAVSDAPHPRATDLLLALGADSDSEDEEAIAQFARAAAHIGDPRFLPIFLVRLAQRAGRGAVRDALVTMGAPALAFLREALRDPKTPRAVRLHIPRSISCFASQAACDALVEALAEERDGLVRYKIVRGLGRLVARHHMKVDRVRMERVVRGNLEEHLRLLAQRTALAPSVEAFGARGARDGQGENDGHDAHDARAATVAVLLLGLLDDKLRQSSERAFRLLKLAHPGEDIHRVHSATLSRDQRVRANAGEFLDALLARRDQQPLRELLRVVLDDAADPVRVERAAGAAMVSAPPLVRERDEAIAALVDDHDDALAALAACHALSLGGSKLFAAVSRAREARPALLALESSLPALAAAQGSGRG
jgi:ATP/ADP translocase